MKTIDEIKINDRSDFDIAEYLNEKYKMIKISGSLHYYNGKYYVNLMRKDAFDTLLMTYERDIVKERGNLNFTNNLLRLLTSEPSIKEINYKDSNRYISFDDCEFDITTRQFIPHNPEHFTWLHFPFKIKEGVTGHCPKFDQYLYDLWDGDDEMTLREYEILGWLMSPDTSSRSFLYLYGPPKSGKSKRLEFYKDMFFKNSMTSTVPLHDLGESKHNAKIAGSFLNICGELPDEPIGKKAVTQMKQFTGGDEVFADPKYQQQFSFTPIAKFIFASNHILKLKCKDEAFLSRIVYLPMMNSIEYDKIEKDFYRKFEEEIPNIAYKSLLIFLSTNPILRGFSGEDKIRNMIGIKEEIVKNDDNEIRNFINQNFVITRKEEDLIPSNVLFDEFLDYFQETKITTTETFTKKLFKIFPKLEKKHKRINGKVSRCIAGIKKK